VLLVAPSPAAACAPQDPQTRGEPDLCVDSQTIGCPTAKGETGTGFDQENIPEDALGRSIKPILTFSSPCPNATLSQTVNVDAPTNERGKRGVRVDFTWTGTGPSAGGTPTATFTVEFEEEVRDPLLTIEQHPTKIRTDEQVTFVIRAYNPNDDPLGRPAHPGLKPLYLDGTPLGDLRPGHATDFSVRRVFSTPSFEGCDRGASSLIICDDLMLPAHGTGVVHVVGFFYHPGKMSLSLQLAGDQISDGELVDAHVNHQVTVAPGGVSGHSVDRSASLTAYRLSEFTR
jgi:hypothetical protein